MVITLWYYLLNTNFVNIYLSKDNTSSDDKHFEGHGVCIKVDIGSLNLLTSRFGVKNWTEIKPA